MKKHSTKIFFLIAVILAFFSRGFNLGGMITPYWEEVALGFDAYSIVQTGADHHGNAWPIVAFESFGDWKPSGYFYFAAAAIKVFGLSVFAVRVPSMVAGLLIVIGMYFLPKVLIEQFASTMPKRQVFSIQLISLLVSAISSWLIMFSRGAWEVNVATAFLLWGVICYLLSFRVKNIYYLIPSVLFFVLSAYTYHATRVIAPLFLLGLLYVTSFQYIQAVLQIKKSSYSLLKIAPITEIIVGIIFLLLLAPLISSSKSASVSQRFAETSIFSSLAVIEESNQAISLAQNPGARLYYHRYVLFTREIIKNAASHLTYDFLFVHGDVNKRHATGYTGVLYYFDIVLLLTGIYVLVKRYKKLGFVVAVAIGLGLIPASISLATPHALRILPVAPFILFVLALGASELYFYGKAKLNTSAFNMCMILCVTMYMLQYVAFWRYYTAVYPQESALEWQYGYSETMTEVETYVLQGKRVAVSRAYGRPAMYYFFVNAIDPQKVQDRRGKERMDQSEFLSYNTITFYDSTIDLDEADVFFVSAQDTQLIRNLDEITATLVYEIKSPMGEILWRGYEK